MERFGSTIFGFQHFFHVKYVLHQFRIQTSFKFFFFLVCLSPTWMSGPNVTKGDLKVDGLRKKLCDDLLLFSLMHKQCSLLSLF